MICGCGAGRVFSTLCNRSLPGAARSATDMDGGCISGVDIMVAPDWSICVTYGLGVFVCWPARSAAAGAMEPEAGGFESFRARQVSGHSRAWSGRYCCQDCYHWPLHPPPVVSSPTRCLTALSHHILDRSSRTHGSAWLRG